MYIYYDTNKEFFDSQVLITSNGLYSLSIYNIVYRDWKSHLKKNPQINFSVLFIHCLYCFSNGCELIGHAETTLKDIESHRYIYTQLSLLLN